jgi:NodT family efflux transporter outer membrane factor (OMF) lipoprotein
VIRPTLIVSTLVALSGCAVGPDYRTPAANAPAAWDAAAPTGTIALERWWLALGDNQLDQVVHDALAANHDLRIATARVREARAALGLAVSATLPQVDAAGSIDRSRASEYRTQGFGDTYSTLYRAGFDAGWEIDLFGGTRRGVEAAVYDLEAQGAALRDVQVSVVSEVVVAWLDLSAANERLELALATVASQRQTHDLAAARYAAGLVNSADLSEAEAQIAQAEAQIPALESAKAQALVRLGVLTGRRIDAMRAAVTAPSRIPQPQDVLAIGLPSDLITRRPDVVVVERNLAAATARIGQAKGEWFPKFSLTGSFGYEATSDGSFTSSANQFWSIGPAVRWPILSGGRIRANIRAADARAEQAAIRYEQVVLNAFGEVESALVSLAREQERLRSLGTALAAQDRALAVAQERFTRGLDAYEGVLRAQRLQIDLQDRVVLSRRAVGQNLASLAKALGGGWSTPVARRAATATPE